MSELSNTTVPSRSGLSIKSKRRQGGLALTLSFCAFRGMVRGKLCQDHGFASYHAVDEGFPSSYRMNRQVEFANTRSSHLRGVRLHTQHQERQGEIRNLALCMQGIERQNWLDVLVGMLMFGSQKYQTKSQIQTFCRLRNPAGTGKGSWDYRCLRRSRSLPANVRASSCATFSKRIENCGPTRDPNSWAKICPDHPP
jgi:hypothetical protein